MIAPFSTLGYDTTPHESRLLPIRGASCFKSFNKRYLLAPIVSKYSKKNAPYARGFAAWVAGQETNGRRKNHVAARRRTPLFLWNKTGFLLLLLSVQTKRVASLSSKCHPMLRDSAFWEGSNRCRDKTKSRRFSKSKSVCAGWSGNVPRLCAIWTPQCGEMKGKLCFIKRKSKGLVSNNRRFCEKNVSIFEGEERLNKNLWTFLRNVPSFLFFLPAFLEKTPVPSPTMTLAVSSSALPYARTDTPLRIAHSASSQFLPSPFTFTRNSLIQCVLRVKEMPFFRLHREGNKGEAFTRKSLFPSFL